MEKGLFIAVEGIEGSGKSTLAASLSEALIEKGRSTLLTKEPGGTDLGKELRKLLLDSKHKLSTHTETLLFLADRAHHLSELVIPSLNSGLSVVCDRFFFSTLAYQGFARGLDLASLTQLARFAQGSALPDLVLLVDLPVEVALARAQARRNDDSESWNRFEDEQIAFHQKVRNGFLSLAKQYADFTIVLNGELNRGELLKEAITKVEERLLK